MINSRDIVATTKPTILIMAGGTGGHIFPGIAVADALSADNWQVHWLGTANKMEADLVPKYGYDISYLTISGVRGKSILSFLTAPFKLFKAIRQAKKVIVRINPDVVLGMGGYASAPGGIAAWILKKPLVIHEQNAVAGLSNRLLANIADNICCAFPNAFSSKHKVNTVGNPLRKSIIPSNADINHSVVQESHNKNILVVGGSLGAQVLNETMPKSYASLAVNKGVAIWHQTGKKKQKKVIAAYSQKAIASGDVKITEFIDDMAAAYQWADIVICRAGALTVSELAMAATPAIFVPLPHAVDDHQTKNAEYLVNHNAAKLIPQSQLTAESMTTMIVELFADSTILSTMASNAYQAATVDATEQVTDVCKQYTDHKGQNTEYHEERL